MDILEATLFKGLSAVDFFVRNTPFFTTFAFKQEMNTVYWLEIGPAVETNKAPLIQIPQFSLKRRLALFCFLETIYRGTPAAWNSLLAIQAVYLEILSLTGLI